MRSLLSIFGVSTIFSVLLFTLVNAGEVLIYTGTTGWISKAAADEQAQICVDQLDALGIANSWAQSDMDVDAVADWVSSVTDNGELDVLVLYGNYPASLYPPPNTMADDSIGELFIESEDGDAIINHADYMFYASGTGVNNEVGGLQNMMDIPGISMWDDNTPMTVTPEGAQVAPTLTEFLSDRPFHVDELAGDWFVELALAENEDGTRADPIIVRDGERGRLIPVIQTADGNEPKGAVASEIIAWLYDEGLSAPTQLGLSGQGAGHPGDVLQYTVALEDSTGARRPTNQVVTVNLSSDSASGAFDTAADGVFDGTVTTVTIAAGESSVDVFYKDTTAGTATLSVTTDALEGAEYEVLLIDPETPNAPPGGVTIYTGNVNWISKALADEQAQICVDLLSEIGIENQWFQSDLDAEFLSEWVEESTGNGQLDVLVLYGWFPPSIYPAGNVTPDDSIAEAFIETEDGDAIINHADWMCYVSETNNGAEGLQNIMDIPGISMSGDNNPMGVTTQGAEIAPTLVDFLSDRPFHVDELAGRWMVEAALAQSPDGTRADPIIVRDGNLGRLIPLYQAADQNDPKGAVAAEIIAWLMGTELPAPSQLALSGPGNAIEGKVTKVDVLLEDVAGYQRPAETDLVVDLATDSVTGAFDTQADGAFDGSVSSIAVASGASSASVYYRDTAEGTVLLTASAVVLDPAELQVKILPYVPVSPGEIAIYTGTVGWISKEAADQQAQIAVDLLDAEGIPNVWYQSDLDGEDLAAWVESATDDGQFDVLVLYGAFPPSLYPNPNVMPDDSIAEYFIESTDGDAIINHADWMFYVSGAADNNGAAGLQNMMDIPGIVMGPDDTTVIVTPEGAEIAPSLEDFLSDRSFHVDELDGDWTVEVALAQNASGTRADPVIVRDGNHGRIIPVIQTNSGDEPKGAVSAEIITWMMEEFTSGPSVGPQFLRSDANADGLSNVTDGIFILNSLFKAGSPAPSCAKSADVDDSGTVNLTDGVVIFLHLFSSGSPPPAPYPSCGVDPTDDSLPCEAQEGCL